MGQQAGEQRAEGPYGRSGRRLPGDPAPGTGLADSDSGPGVTRPPGAADPGRRGISYARAFVRALPGLLIAAGAVYEYLTPPEPTPQGS
ncbi:MULTISPECIES: hypothetical protein [Streptomyces]|uniref:Uncharacterized protein n=1 Tax=Streptomyces dengpaensis TaxID=2049881 RepID=A0ABM6STA5_9ACTN|nr:MULTISPECIES: hypothetical protein [Streptomyces]AVH57907.1 hypothetical protein C4B68_21475 [Streptomyces dengpaensis]PIB03907.1 hypothetical protein B1C81_35245 [Streptomyces sp. HG99]